MFTMRKNNKGFTLIELMIAVAIIGILVIFAVPNFVYYRNKAIIASAVGSCESLRTAMASYACSSNSNLFPVDEWTDGPAGWAGFREFFIPLGTTFKNNMKEQGFQDFIYRTIEVDGEDGTDYFFVFETAGSVQTQVGALIEVSPSGIHRWTGSL
jgi:prepilin-type N-terminal cleavage/methylation domain-containing protein